MSDIVELAERLGNAIAASPEAARLRKARKALQDKPEASQLLKDYGAQAEKMAQLEKDQKPVEVEDKHKLEDLHGKLASSETFKAFSAAQVDYVDLMRKVNQAINKSLRDVEPT